MDRIEKNGLGLVEPILGGLARLAHAGGLFNPPTNALAALIPTRAIIDALRNLLGASDKSSSASIEKTEPASPANGSGARTGRGERSAAHFFGEASWTGRLRGAPPLSGRVRRALLGDSIDQAISAASRPRTILASSVGKALGQEVWEWEPPAAKPATPKAAKPIGPSGSDRIPGVGEPSAVRRADAPVATVVAPPPVAVVPGKPAPPSGIAASAGSEVPSSVASERITQTNVVGFFSRAGWDAIAPARSAD